MYNNILSLSQDYSLTFLLLIFFKERSCSKQFFNGLFFTKYLIYQFYSIIKLRMEMGNVPKRQQPDHRKKQQQKVTNRSSM